MILGTIRRILKEDMAKFGDTPAWMDAFLQTLNPFIDSVGTALKGNLTFKDNFLCKVTTQTFTHGTELVMNSGSGHVVGVLPVLSVKSTDSTAQKNVISGCGVNLKGNGTIGVTINFGGGAGIKADVTLIILYG